MLANSGGNAPYLLGSLLPRGNYDFLLNVNMEDGSGPAPSFGLGSSSSSSSASESCW